MQPNSQTDDPDDIVWQVFDSFSSAVGDVVLGNNPVSGETAKIAGIERALPHCCLAHIDTQARVEQAFPGSAALWFQSLGSTVQANVTFDLTVDKMLEHASKRTGPYGLYFETGQGADATNGAGAGFDMVIHESRKYGFARALKQKVAQARGGPAWVILNDVAGFIGPDVFRTREQLVRCCLEDIAMGKLHGLPIGMDICSTLHMSVGLDDLDWSIDQIMPANPAYRMALPTKNDPMLSYLTTASQDHVRIRERVGYKVNDAMRSFYRKLGAVNADGTPGPHFGDPKWVFLQYRRAKGDKRNDAASDRRATGVRASLLFGVAVRAEGRDLVAKRQAGSRRVQGPCQHRRYRADAGRRGGRDRADAEEPLRSAAAPAAPTGCCGAAGPSAAPAVSCRGRRSRPRG